MNKSSYPSIKILGLSCIYGRLELVNQPWGNSPAFNSNASHKAGWQEEVTGQTELARHPNRAAHVSSRRVFRRASSVHSSQTLPLMICSPRWQLWLIATWPRTAPRPPLAPFRLRSAQVLVVISFDRILTDVKIQNCSYFSSDYVQEQPSLGPSPHTFTAQRQFTRLVTPARVLRLDYDTSRDAGKIVLAHHHTIFAFFVLLCWTLRNISTVSILLLANYGILVKYDCGIFRFISTGLI